MSLVDGQGGEDGEDLAVEELTRGGHGRPGSRVVPVGHHDPLQPGGPAPAARRRAGSARRRARQLERRWPDTARRGSARPVNGCGGRPPPGPRARPPDLKELVEAFGEEGQEVDPVEEGKAVVGGQLEEAGTELEPGEVAVEETRRLRGDGQVAGGLPAAGRPPIDHHVGPNGASATGGRGGGGSRGPDGDARTPGRRTIGHGVRITVVDRGSKRRPLPVMVPPCRCPGSVDIGLRRLPRRLIAVP